MKHFFLMITLSLFTILSFAQDRNFKLVKTPTENPTNQKRKAIVIGMSDYGSGKSLDNTLNDADDMAGVLTRLGFEVTLLKNNNLQNLETNLNDWYTRIEGNDMAIFYFAGHGMEVNGVNYLIPIEAELNSQTDVQYKTINVNQVLGNMNEKRVGMKLFILDACRDNPFKRSWSRGSEEKGLAEMRAPRGTYIAFAAEPGSTAQDGGNYKLRNGVFTHYLKQVILECGLTIHEIFDEVTKSVSTLTNDQQNPYRSINIGERFVFKPPCLSGTVTINGLAEFDQTLSAVTADLTSSPAGITPTGFTYQWRRGTTNISGATSSTYKIAAADIGNKITVVVSANNCTGSVTSPATVPVVKAPQTIPTAPTMTSNTSTSITLTAMSGAEYRRGTDAWQNDSTFSGLTAETSYNFIQRMKETATHLASGESKAASITTASPPVLSGMVTISGLAEFDQSLTAVTADLTSTPVGTTPTGLTYQWKRNAVNIRDATSSTYKLVAADIGNKITVEISTSNCVGSVTSPATASVTKAMQTTPAAPTMVSNTTTSITLTAVSGAEYRRGAGAWQNNSSFTGLTVETSYSFTQRMKETATHLASGESTEASITTAPPSVLSGTVIISGLAEFDQSLTAVTSNLTSTPAGSTPTGLTYQWKRNTMNINDATSSMYKLVAADIANKITVEVSANNCVGSVTSPATAMVTKATQTTPVAPTMLSNTTTSIILTAVSGAEYRIGTDAWQSSTIFDGLESGKYYSFSQRFKGTETHLPSNESEKMTVLFTKPLQPPSAPVDFKARAGDRQVTLTWKPPTEDGGSSITSYLIYNGATIIHEAKMDDTNYTVVRLLNGTSYTFEIHAVNDAGKGSSNTTSAIPRTTPSAPLDFKAKAGDKQVILTWKPPADDGGSPITSYLIYNDATIIHEAKMDDINYTVEKLINGTKYAFEIRAVNDAGKGSGNSVYAMPELPLKPKIEYAICASSGGTMLFFDKYGIDKMYGLGLAFEGGPDFTLKFPNNPKWFPFDIRIGAYVSWYRYSISLDHLDTKNLIETPPGLDVSPFYMKTDYRGYKERHDIYYLRIPIMFQYRLPRDFYVTVGPALNCPVIKSKCDISSSAIITKGHSDFTSQDYLNLPNHGFGTYQDIIKDNIETDFGIAWSIAIEAGWKCKNNQWYIGGFLDYGLNNICKGSATKVSIEYNPDGPPHTFNSILNSQNDGEAMTRKVHPFAAGVQLRYVINRKKS